MKSSSIKGVVVTQADLEKLAAWYRGEYDRRTEALEAGGGKLDWVAPEYRVSRTEVVAHAESIGIMMSAQDNIDLFKYLTRKKDR